MNSVTLTLSPYYDSYSSQKSSSLEMYALGLFLSSAIGDSKKECLFFKEWALADKADPHGKFGYGCGTNATSVEEDENGNIHIVDDTGSDDDDEYYIPGRMIVTRQQFIRLLDDWQEKVCELKPKEVIITYDNDQFSIEING
jgi:hypothetical protein